jgi:hypothetical protein
VVGHRGQDAPAFREDLEIAGAALAEEQFPFACAAEEQMRMGVDQAGRHRAAVGIETREALEWQALYLELRFHLRARPDGHDPAVPARDDGSVGTVRSTGFGSFQHRRVGLGRAAAKPAGHRHDRGRAVDDESIGGALAAPPGDQPEAHPVIRRSRWQAAVRAPGVA